MRRFQIIIAILIVILSLGFFSYHYIQQQQLKDTSQMFDQVMSEKMALLYDQAQDWSKPVQLDIHDRRLAGNYKKISEFLLNYWVQNINARNAYLRALKAAQWDTFLDVTRLEQDQKQQYAQTQKMLNDVRQASVLYQNQYEQIHQAFLTEAKTLSVETDMRILLEKKIGSNQKVDQDHAIFLLEMQILDKADAMFAILKTHAWERNGKKILFRDTAQVKAFNQLYQDVLRLNAKIESIKKRNMAALDQQLKDAT